MFSISQYYSFGFFLLVLIGSISYPLGGDGYEKQLNLIVVFLFSIYFAFLLIRLRKDGGNVSFAFGLLLFVLLWMFLVSLIQNSPVEWLPTVLRYLLYLLVYSLSFLLALQGKLSSRFVETVLLTCLIIGTVSGLFELFFGEVRFINGAYRLSGNFNLHHLGYALYMFVPLVYFGLKIIEKLSYRLFFIWCAGIFMFYLSHSRSLMVFLVVSLLSSLILWHRSYMKKILWLCVSIVFFFIFYCVIAYSDYFPRLNELIFLEYADQSSLYRIFVFQESLSSLPIFAWFFGIGAGGFNEFFYSVTGIIGTAAHNDYLLVLVEGGFFVFILYVFYQILVLKYYFSLSRSSVYLNYRAKAAFLIFVFLEILGFLLNIHYFYQSEVLVCLLIGFSQGEYERKIRLES